MAWGLWFHFWLVIVTMVFGSLAIFFSFLDPSRNVSQVMARWWGAVLVYIAGISLQVEGMEHLVPGQTYVYAANHRSNFDIFVLISTLPGKFLFVAKKSLFQIPLFGQVLTRMGYISVDRSNQAAAIRSLNHATARVKAGTSMIIFPEGTRVTVGELLPFKKGVFIMAMKAGQPIVPVSISGTRFIQPRASLRIRPGPVKVVLSPPIFPQEFKRKEDLMAAVRQALEANYDPDFPYGPGGSPRITG
ncbi:MAG: lysophospholipid acyltransferase family protein [Pseudomonadota bacterium]